MLAHGRPANNRKIRADVSNLLPHITTNCRRSIAKNASKKEKAIVRAFSFVLHVLRRAIEEMSTHHASVLLMTLNSASKRSRVLALIEERKSARWRSNSVAASS